MNKQEVIKFWRDSAEDNLKTAIYLFDGKKYRDCLFFCHLAIEKLLKACVIKVGKVPPYTHDLIRLAKLTGYRLNDEYLAWLEEITDFNIDSRYDDEKLAFYKKATIKFAEKWLFCCQKIIKWLEQNLNN